ncbi:MAG: hypothetical protein MJ095_00025 [Oscillospiraceae bacterium]|nr:hypothetical protein [Oscillospiraceae bacterium]
MKIPKDIVEKIQLRNKINEEIAIWLSENVDINGGDLWSAEIVNIEDVFGDEQGDDEGREWCDQSQLGEDYFYGYYFWETEDDRFALKMSFSC